MHRIEHLRQYCLSNPIPVESFRNKEFFYRFYKTYIRDKSETEEERYAKSYFAAFSQMTPSISPGELIVGKPISVLTEEEEAEWETILPLAEARCSIMAKGQDSHLAIDYELVLHSGTSGIRGKIDKYLKTCEEDKIPFYEACKICLAAVEKHAENYAALAEAKAEAERDPIQKAELLEIARICRKVPMHPAETFHEAVQCVNFITYCVALDPLRQWQQQFQLGHPDRYLLPYYTKDLQNGTLTREKARLLLACLGIQLNNRTDEARSAGWMVGGRDETGAIVQNDLTMLLMEVIEDVRLVYPAVGLCYTEGMEDKFLRTACRILSHGHSHPAVFGDDTIQKGLMSYGLSPQEACNYIHSTCVEITPVASSNVWVNTPATNVITLLLPLMEQEYDSFDVFFASLLEAFSQRIAKSVERRTEERKARAAHSMKPLLSCFTNDCLARGLDTENGGARYNWIQPNFVGMGNLVDSLYAVKDLVFDKKQLTMTQFKAILDANYEGHEPLRRYILNKLPKYGNDDDAVDQYYMTISQHITKECRKHNCYHPNGNVIPGFFCWELHERYGKVTGATPDGRVAKFPLGDGSGPCQGREMTGPTASVLSSTKWDHSAFIGGVAVNLKFSKTSLGKSSLDTMMAIVKTYLKRGGFELQINVVDNETLKKAQKNPEAYRDLVVRIGGYSDYFVRLSPEMQEEVISRTTHHV